MNIINNNRPIIIGIDHGFGNVKTAHTCFKTGVTTHDKEPTFKSDLLIFEGRYQPGCRSLRCGGVGVYELFSAV